MKTQDIISLANWVRAELRDAEENGDVVSRIDALKRVRRVLASLPEDFAD